MKFTHKVSGSLIPTREFKTVVGSQTGISRNTPKRGVFEHKCVSKTCPNLSDKLLPRDKSVVDSRSHRNPDKIRWPNMGPYYVKGLGRNSLIPPNALKGSIKKFLYRKRYKVERSTMKSISDLLIGEAFFSKWFYTGLVSHIRHSQGWLRITRPIPFKFIPLVLRQIAYVPSTVPSKILISLLSQSSKDDRRQFR